MFITKLSQLRLLTELLIIIHISSSNVSITLHIFFTNILCIGIFVFINKTKQLVSEVNATMKLQ